MRLPGLKKKKPQSPFTDTKASSISPTIKYDMRALKRAIGNFRTSSRNKRVVVLQGKECQKATLPVAGVTAFVFVASPPLFSVQSTMRPSNRQINKQAASTVSFTQPQTHSDCLDVACQVQSWNDFFFFLFLRPPHWCAITNIRH